MAFNNCKHHNNTQIINNMKELVVFYEEVKKDFIDRLYNEFRYKKKEVADQIEKFDKVIERNMLNHEVLFEKSIAMKEGSFKYDLEFIKNQYPKVELDQEKENQIKLEANQSPEPSHLNEADPEDEDVDDLIHFGEEEDQELEKENKLGNKKIKPNQEDIKEEFDVKEEDHSQKEEEVEEIRGETGAINRENEASDSDEEDRIFSEKAEKELNSIIVGTFLSSTIKRKPKEEKTSIELENVFLKVYGRMEETCREAYYNKMTIEVVKAEKKSIKQQDK